MLRALIDFTLASAARTYVALGLICAALFLPGIAALPPIDRDEARFMQASKQMVETGDFAHVRLQDQPRDKKPPGAYWLQAAAAEIFSDQGRPLTWPYRLPSILGALLAVMATAAAARRKDALQDGMVAGVVLATMALVVTEAHLAKADALQFGLAAVCFATMLRAYTDRQTSAGGVFIFWLALGASLLVKGPVIAALCLTTMAALAVADRDARWIWRLRPIIGIPTAWAVAGLWVPVAGLEEVKRAIGSGISQDLLPKLLGGVESHGAPPGTHLVAAFFTLWPWSAALPAAGLLAWAGRTRPDIRFCLAWIVPFWLALEIVPTKLPHYILPLLPAIAVLVAEAFRRPQEIERLIGPKTVAAGKLAALAFPLVAVTALWVGHGLMQILMSMAFMACVVPPLLIALWSYDRQIFRAHAPHIAVLATAFYGLLLGGVAPGANVLTLSPRLHAAIERAGGAKATVALAGYHEPSAVFVMGTETVLTDGRGAAAHVLAARGNFAAVSRDELAAAEDEIQRAGYKLVRHAEISGYNYAKGQSVTLHIIQAAP